MGLRLAFMGTADFAVPSLAALIGAGHDVAAVYSQPARPRGRGHKPQPSPVAALAMERGIAVRTPERLDANEIAAFAALGLDAAIVAAYGLILPPAVLDGAASRLPQRSCLAAAALARRGADRARHPCRRQRDRNHHHAHGRGPRHRPDPARGASADRPAHDRRGTARRTALGAAQRCWSTALDRYARGPIAPKPQPEAGVTYAKKLRREEGAIDWRRPAIELDRLVRALNPRLPTWFMHGGERISVCDAIAEPRAAARRARCSTTSPRWRAARARSSFCACSARAAPR